MVNPTVPAPIRQRMRDLLRAQPAHRFCTGCLSGLLDTSEASARMAMVTLEAEPGATRGYGTCSRCGKDRIVVGAVGEVDAGR